MSDDPAPTLAFGPVGLFGCALLLLGILKRSRVVALLGLAGVVADVTVAELGGFKAMNETRSSATEPGMSDALARPALTGSLLRRADDVRLDVLVGDLDLQRDDVEPHGVVGRHHPVAHDLLRDVGERFVERRRVVRGSPSDLPK